MRVNPRFFTVLGFFGAVLCSAPSAWAICTATDRTDCVDRLTSYTGTIDFFASGASFAVAEDPGDDRPNRPIEIASVTIPASRIPERAKLLAAYLYFGGSLFIDNDGMDEPDMAVDIKLPGANEFRSVQGEQTYTSGAIPGFSEVSLYTVRSDITSIMLETNGPLVGTYEVKNFSSDIS